MPQWRNCVDHEFVQHPKYKSACLICQRIYSNKKAKESRARASESINQYKMNTGCVKCGYKEHFAALEFDHIVPVKNVNRSVMTRKSGTNLKSLIDDPNIQLLCAICHRIKTWNNGDYKKKDDI